MKALSPPIPSSSPTTWPTTLGEAAFRDRLRSWLASQAGTFPAVGDEAPVWIRQFLGADMETLIARDSLMILRGSPGQMADELQSRRDTLGVSYLSVNAAFMELFAPVVEDLTGR